MCVVQCDPDSLKPYKASVPSPHRRSGEGEGGSRCRHRAGRVAEDRIESSQRPTVVVGTDLCGERRLSGRTRKRIWLGTTLGALYVVEFVKDDHTLQKTTFANGIAVYVNFSDDLLHADKNDIPSMGCAISKCAERLERKTPCLWSQSLIGDPWQHLYGRQRARINGFRMTELGEHNGQKACGL